MMLYDTSEEMSESPTEAIQDLDAYSIGGILPFTVVLEVKEDVTQDRWTADAYGRDVLWLRTEARHAAQRYGYSRLRTVMGQPIEEDCYGPGLS